jgi:hypothetical protein
LAVGHPRRGYCGLMLHLLDDSLLCHDDDDANANANANDSIVGVNDEQSRQQQRRQRRRRRRLGDDIFSGAQKTTRNA